MKLLLALLFVGASCSCTVNLAGDHRALMGRNVAQEVDATAMFTVRCGNNLKYGSGVQVSDYFVLTAGHVVHCDGDVTPVITVAFGDDQGERAAVVDAELSQIDVARVALTLPRPTTPIAVGPRPGVGDRVCEAAAVPRWTYRCFTVDPGRLAEAFDPDAGVGSGTGPDAPAMIFVDGSIEHGNSGAGVYDDYGLLVGISDAAAMCEYTPCVGVLAALQGARLLGQ